MKVYHYTSIETLALILKNKTIRFNRLDHVDDCEESLYGSGPTNIKLGQYTFVSCWTKDSTENLSLWKMYTNNKGVRIGLEEDMFISYPCGEKRSFFESDKIVGNAFISKFTNFPDIYDILYVTNPEENIKKIVEQVGTGAFIKTDQMGMYKRKEWAFQQECRFKINVNPINPKFINGNTDIIGSIAPSIASNTPVNVSYIDVRLDEAKLNSIEIMMGPMTTLGEKVIVEYLTADLGDKNIIDSYFKGKIRSKG